MRIAQVAPLYESVPPRMYGGTERVVSYLTEELVAQGHDVTLFASGDSVTRAELVATTPRALRLDEQCVDRLAHHLIMLEEVDRRAREFDLIHYHVDYLHFPWSRRCPVPHLTTLHGRLDIPDLLPLYREFAEMPVVSISVDQRTPLPRLEWRATVPHGLPRDLLTFSPSRGHYLAFLGRISPEKRVDRAVEIASRAGIPLRIAAKVDPADREYYADVIEPMLAEAGAAAEYVGEISDAEKSRFLGGALALLFPIDWPEPFGLAMIEAMACGTPVVAWRRGSVPEVIEEGVTGFMVDGIDEAVRAVGRAARLDRSRCRAEFEARFTAERMARDYVEVYRGLVGQAATGVAGADVHG